LNTDRELIFLERKSHKMNCHIYKQIRQYHSILLLNGRYNLKRYVQDDVMAQTS